MNIVTLFHEIGFLFLKMSHALPIRESGMYSVANPEKICETRIQIPPPSLILVKMSSPSAKPHFLASAGHHFRVTLLSKVTPLTELCQSGCNNMPTIYRRKMNNAALTANTVLFSKTIKFQCE